MPNLPAATNGSSDLSTKDQRFIEIVVEALMAGLKPADIARLATEDRKKRKHLRKKIWRWLEGNPHLQQAIGQRAQAMMVSGLPAASEALMKRASRGRPDAIKLAFEASGFHNPRVKHEHSGDIKISLDMPRPKPVAQPATDDEDIVDAEVVDE
jgi:hypothetical protein